LAETAAAYKAIRAENEGERWRTREREQVAAAEGMKIEKELRRPPQVEVDIQVQLAMYPLQHKPSQHRIIRPPKTLTSNP